VHGILLINSMMGGVVLLGLWPLIIILFYSGVEPVADVTSIDIDLFLLVNACFAVSYYILYTFGMTATSPLYISMTGLVGMPMAALADWVLKSKEFSTLTLVGMGLVCLGVLSINIHLFFDRQVKRLLSCVATTLCSKRSSRTPNMSTSSLTTSEDVDISLSRNPTETERA